MLPALATELLRLHNETNHAVRGGTWWTTRQVTEAGPPSLDDGKEPTGFQTFQRRVGKIRNSVQRYRGQLVTRQAITMCGPLTAEDAPEHNGSTTLAIMTVVGLMTEIAKAAGKGGESEMYEARENVTTKKEHHTF